MRGFLLVFELDWNLGFRNQTELVTSLGSLANWGWPWWLGDHMWDMAQSFCVSHWSPHHCCSNYGNSMGESSNPWCCYLHCLEPTSLCRGMSGQWQLEVRVYCRDSIWLGQNIVWQFWTSPLVMLRAVVRLSDSAASSHKPRVSGRQGKFLFVVPLSLAWVQHPVHTLVWQCCERQKRVPRQRTWPESSRLGLLSWDLCLSHAG